MAIVGAAPQRALRPIERWHKATAEFDFAERDRLLARARELGPRHRDAGEILAAHAAEQARVTAELVRGRSETLARVASPADSAHPIPNGEE
jgi:hypothetical protein